MPTQTAPHTEQVRRLRADAAALCQVIADADLRGGFWVHDLQGGPEDLQGLAIGSGHAFSAWAGDQLGRQAVAVAAGQVLEVCQSRHSTELAQPIVEATALHEVAHIVWGTDTLSPEQIGQRMQQLPRVADLARASTKRTADHGLIWAATLSILATRARRYRRDPELLAYAVSSDLASHGWCPDTLRAHIGPVDDRASLRDVLDPAGMLMRELLAAQLHYQRPLHMQEPGQHCAAMAACITPR